MTIKNSYTIAILAILVSCVYFLEKIVLSDKLRKNFYKISSVNKQINKKETNIKETDIQTDFRYLI